MRAPLKSLTLVAVDVGIKRIGLALYLQGVILPLDPIVRHNRQQASQELLALLALKKPQKLIVGLPHARYVDTTRRILHFVSLLDFAPIVYTDEDASSQQALEHTTHLRFEKRQEARKNGTLDSLAACEILRRYIASQT